MSNRPKTSAGSTRRTRSIAIEELESRTLPSAIPLTIITHGWNSDAETWVADMARANNEWRIPDPSRGGERCHAETIRGAIFGPKPLRDGTQLAAPAANACRHFLLLNWESGSPLRFREGEAGRTNAVESLFTQVRNRLNSGYANLHFIGHSRGAVVNNEVIKRLHSEGLGERVGFVQMTMLDPHPVNATDDPFFNDRYGYNDPQIRPERALVDFTDNYYQTVFLPYGQPIEGWVDVSVNVSTNLRRWHRNFLAHTAVHDWYHWTIDTRSFSWLRGEFWDVYGHVPNITDDERTHPARGIYQNHTSRDFDKDGTADFWDNGKKVGYYWSLLGGGLGPEGTRTSYDGLDLVFAIDASGSMEDDINAVKEAAVQIVHAARENIPNTQFGVVTYKNFGSGSDYVTRTNLPLTSNTEVHKVLFRRRVCRSPLGFSGVIHISHNFECLRISDFFPYVRGDCG